MVTTHTAIQATGRRKNAVASVQLIEGTGKLLANGRDFTDYFPSLSARNYVLQPLKLTNTDVKFDVFAKLTGGGTMGQAGALRHAIARALIADPPVLIMDEPTAGLDVPTQRMILDLLKAARSRGKTIREVVIERGLLTAEQFDALISPERVTRLGYPLREQPPRAEDRSDGSAG